MNGVDPRARNTPDNEDQILARAVDEFVQIRAVLTEPRLAVRDGRVSSNVGAQGGEFAGISSGKGRGTFPVKHVSVFVPVW